MSGSELMELLDQVEGAIRDFSEELVQQLARRDHPCSLESFGAL